MWTGPVHPEVLLASGYALLLLAMAVGLGQWASHAKVHRGQRVDLASATRREGEQPLAAWPHTEIAHFHHGLALLLVLVAGAVTVIGLARHHEGTELLLLGLALGLTALVAAWLLSAWGGAA
jgi:hypothetical protein